MSRIVCNNKGMSMVEVLIAILLTAIGLITLSSLQDTGWRSMAKSDYFGRAAGILNNTLESYYAAIANPSNPVTTGPQTEDTVTTSGGTAIKGDITYTVNATITQINPDPQSFVVTVTITWPGNTQGISESLTVTRQDSYKFP
jgi:Tfp pilus assembly protein PilV